MASGFFVRARNLLVGRGARSGVSGRLGGDAEQTVGWLACLRGDGGDVASLGADGMEGAVSVLPRAVLFPDTYRVSDHALAVAGKGGG